MSLGRLAPDRDVGSEPVIIGVMTRLVSLFALLVALVTLSSTVVRAELDLAGEWTVTFTGPTGPAEYTMFATQEGNRIRGRFTSASGEFPLRGTITGDKFEITWELPDNGRMLQIVFTGTVEGDTMTATAKIGKNGEGPVHGERVGR